MKLKFLFTLLFASALTIASGQDITFDLDSVAIDPIIQNDENGYTFCFNATNNLTDEIEIDVQTTNTNLNVSPRSYRMAAGETREFRVYYAALNVGQFLDSVYFVLNDTESPVSSSLFVESEVIEAIYSLESLEELFFEPTFVGDTSYTEVWVYNTGNADILIEYTADPTFPFATIDSDSYIEAGNSSLFSFRFTPTEMGSFQSEIQLEGQDWHQVNLSGLAVNNHSITFDLDSVAIDPIIQNDENGYTFYFNATNNLTDEIEIDVQTTNTNLNVSPRSYKMAAGETREFRVYYAALNVGQFLDSVYFVLNDTKSSVSSSLFVESEVIEAIYSLESIEELVFEPTFVGDTSYAQVWVYNTGNADILIEYTADPTFPFATIDSDSYIEAGDSSLFSFRFTPTKGCKGLTNLEPSLSLDFLFQTDLLYFIP